MKMSTMTRIGSRIARVDRSCGGSAALLRRVAKTRISSSPNANPPTCAQ